MAAYLVQSVSVINGKIFISVYKLFVTIVLVKVKSNSSQFQNFAWKIPGSSAHLWMSVTLLHRDLEIFWSVWWPVNLGKGISPHCRQHVRADGPSEFRQTICSLGCQTTWKNVSSVVKGVGVIWEGAYLFIVTRNNVFNNYVCILLKCIWHEIFYPLVGKIF